MGSYRGDGLGSWGRNPGNKSSTVFRSPHRQNKADRIRIVFDDAWMANEAYACRATLARPGPGGRLRRPWVSCRLGGQRREWNGLKHGDKMLTELVVSALASAGGLHRDADALRAEWDDRCSGCVSQGAIHPEGPS